MTNRWQRWLVFIGLVTVDQISKFQAMQAGNAVINPGISFGLLFQIPSFGLTVLIGLIIVVGIYWWRKNGEHFLWSGLLFWAGAVSNWVDRVLYAGVRDWLLVPLLGNRNNLADWYISLGLVLYIGQMIYNWWWEKQDAAHKSI